MSEQHWVHLYESDTYLGAGFLITPGFVLTALHCLRGLSSDEAALTLELPDGRRLPGRKCDAVKERGLALVTVEGAHGHRLAAAPRTDTPRPKVAWNCRYRPPQETAHLSGRVTHAPIAHRCVEGGELEVMQLQVDQLLGSFAGYSGGPVEAGEQERGERPVVGILLEQQLNRQDPGAGRNVLFAATVRYAMEVFPHFGVEHLRALVAAPRSGPARSAADIPPPRARPGNEDILSDAGRVLASLRQWEESGLITAADAEEGRGRTLKRVTDLFGGPDGPDDDD
ncbi:serine protease [Streptomyces sp. NBC_01795]|uniref:hypothetical protein n=1 Tax=Streptomyces sp. NBC_01795 TaxID=2975943 RepID=UPI002DD92F24|nr:hypothetical protein [Streptomyces sp. NBC_01795]WSA90912.1 serine protease [Streptomyces sp. NBC_01795]